MIRPNVNCKIQRVVKRDLYGEERVFGDAQFLKCNVVRLNAKSKKTSVRADSSASRGAARETIFDSRLLFQPIVELSLGDKVTVAGIELKVESIHPRFDMRGIHHHNEVDLSAWA